MTEKEEQQLVDEQDQILVILARRQAFAKKHMKARGWSSNPRELTIEQILEIREQPEWKFPLGEKN